MSKWQVFIVSGEGTDANPRRREALTIVDVSSDVEDEETEARFLGEQFLGDTGHLAYPGFKRLSVAPIEEK